MPSTLTKTHIIEAIAEANGFYRKDAAEITENLIEIIKRTLESGEDVLISGFGKFCVKEKKKRRGRNPATGDDLILNPSLWLFVKKAKGKHHFPKYMKIYY